MLVLFAVVIGVLTLVTAIIIEIGRVRVAKEELQVAADAAALAGAAVLNPHQHSYVTLVNDSVDFTLQKHRVVSSGGVNVAKLIGRYEDSFESFDALPPGTPAYRGGVRGQVWANAVRVTLRKRVNLFFSGILNIAFFSPAATATAIQDHRIAPCVAPFVIPACGITYASDPGGLWKEGDFPWDQPGRQEIIIGPVPNVHNYPPAADSRFEANYPDVSIGVRPDLPSTGYKGYFPLRGGFGVPASRSSSVSASTIVDVLEQTWSDGSLSGCVQAKLGERVYLLEGGFNSNSADAYTQRANRAIVNLLNQSTPERIHSRALREAELDPVKNWVVEDRGYHHCPHAGRIECSGPYRRGGCHDPALQSPGWPPAENVGAWRVKLMVVAPGDSSKDYCGINGDYIALDNASRPKIVGFISGFAFDVQLAVPPACRWSDDCCSQRYVPRTCGTPPDTWDCSYWECVRGSGSVSLDSCRGVRIRPIKGNYWIAATAWDPSDYRTMLVH